MKKILLIAFAAVLLVAFCAPAMAATKKVSFYGDIRFNTWWINKDSDYYAVNNSNTTNDSDSDLQWQMDPYDSRFGAKFSEGPISANVEIRPLSASVYRQWWGAWNMGWGTLLVGHTYVPLCLAIGYSNFDSESIVSYGSFMDRLRAEQIQLTVPFGMGFVKLALVKPPTTEPDYTNGSIANVDTDVKFPQLEMCLNLNFSPVSIDLVGSYHTFDIVNATIDSKAESVTSYIYGGRIKFGMGPFYFKGLLVFGQNVGNGGELTSAGLYYRKMLYDVGNDRSYDSDYTDYGGVLGFKVNDMLTVEVGYFQQKTERYLKEKDKNGAYYIVFPFTPIKGFTIYPEIGVFDDKDVTDSAGNTTDEGKRTYFGAYWKISF